MCTVGIRLTIRFHRSTSFRENNVQSPGPLVKPALLRWGTHRPGGGLSGLGGHSGRQLPGRDQKAHLVPAAPGLPHDQHRHQVVIVGAGIAGLNAAAVLAERGVGVTVLEREPQLGGRARAWPVSGGAGDVDGQRTMSRGFHAFFRQYYNLRALLRRTDPQLQRLVPVEDYPLIGKNGQRDSFTGLPTTPPWNMVAFVLRSPSFRARDLLRIDPMAARELIEVEFPATFARHDGESATEFLDRLRFPDAARHLAFDVFARSFFADPDEFSAGELVGMFHAYFVGSSEGLLFDVPSDDYDTALWAPLADYLRQLDVTIRTGVNVHDLASTADGVVITHSAGAEVADAVVVATDLSSTQRLLAPDTAMRSDGEWRQQLAALRSAPSFAVWRIWLDRPADPDRPAFLGTAGFGHVDNISLLNRFEAGAAGWARQHDGAVVELHAYALPADADDEQLRTEMLAVLQQICPELADAHVVNQEYLRSQDCPLISTQPWHTRPGVTTPDPRVVLAGDGVRCDYPVALMERAATTGLIAANQLLGDWGVAGHDLWTVPLHSRLPLRRRLA